MDTKCYNQITSILEDFIDFLKEKEGDSKEKEVEVIEDGEEVVDDEDDDDFDKAIAKISKGE